MLESACADCKTATARQWRRQAVLRAEGSASGRQTIINQHALQPFDSDHPLQHGQAAKQACGSATVLLSLCLLSPVASIQMCSQLAFHAEKYVIKSKCGQKRGP
jgi:hypothetical protein